MNAIISLCHFCELHGPKVLFCTQPLHPEEKPGENDVDGDGVQRRVTSPSIFSDPQTPLTPTGVSSANSLPNYKNDLCEGCTSVHLGFVSHDEEANVSYMSSQRPQHRDVFAMIRQACIRSLSCEVCPDREGPIFFGDDQQGNTISYTFYIKDNQARGMQRLYSIIVVMMDKIYLLNSWPFLVPNMEIVANKLLKSKANKVFEEEKVKFPQRQDRTHSRVNPMNYLHQRGGNKPARSLVELTDDKQVFKRLHMAFVWMLKACGNRLSETLLEGPPTEDTIIDMEKQEVVEEGFVMLYSKKVGGEDVEEGVDAVSDPSVNQSAIKEALKDDGSPEITDIRHLLKLLGPKRFDILAHHVVIGNQVIVRGNGRTLMRSFLDALTCLLPKGCYRAIPYSDVYVESYKCNFLGLPPKIQLPPHVSKNEPFLLIDVFEPNGEKTKTDPDLLAGYVFKFSTSAELLPDSVPTVLDRMERAIKNENLCLDVLEHSLVCYKEEWMNKVKVLFKFTKAGGGRSEEDTNNLFKVVGAIDVDKPLLSFWMKGLSDQYKKHILAASKHSQST
ncbi:folliculin-like [Mya arenaria]|uniref:folliculin-like n=1 Tax=Mya arenaria TaxID=6604 RepID=UPI0022E8330C|nr:folliculin-like [Mya arenaria]